MTVAPVWVPRPAIGDNLTARGGMTASDSGMCTLFAHMAWTPRDLPRTCLPAAFDVSRLGVNPGLCE
ncbi:hypothetical protein A5791_22725 [Mycobacterium sp. 852002-51163_SCH5372311]|nr:hypothetical protein A5791_22725 [Mycobacterium sp. 852002-51163_SCH5372311]